MSLEMTELGPVGSCKEIDFELFLGKNMFPSRLYQFASSCTTGAIRWNEEGTAIFLDFEKLKQHLRSSESRFTTKKVESFKRQLNMYGFKIANKQNGWYRHEFFLKDQIHLLWHMSRVNPQTNMCKENKEHKLKPGANKTKEGHRRGNKFTETLIKCNSIMKQPMNQTREVEPDEEESPTNKKPIRKAFMPFIFKG